MRKGLASTIADLDLASTDIRVFTCVHHALGNIPDGQNSTREKTDWLIADELFARFRHDEAFMKEYFNERDHVLAHHRAHERVYQGRGSWASDIEIDFRDANWRRGLPQ
jgi:hypothetical protein